MADADLPAKPSALMRYILGGTVLFVFFLLAAEDINTGRYIAAAVWGVLFLAGLALLLGWDRVFHRPEGGPEGQHSRDLRETVLIPVQRDISVQDAVAFALYGHWPAEDEQIFGHDKDLSRMDVITQRMRTLAHEGKFLIWGKKAPQSLHTLIEKEFWENNQIEFLSLWGPPTRVRTESTINDKPPIYVELMVSKAQMEANWPPS